MISVKLLLGIPKKQREFELFMKDNRHVKHICMLNDWDDLFCTDYNYFVETSHSDEKEYIAFVKGIKETFKVRGLVDVQVVAP